MPPLATAPDWSTIASLATAAGTLVLAVATFSSVRSANRSARAAERSLLAGLRPLLVPSRLEDPPEKVGFADGRWLRSPGGHGAAEVADQAVYLAMSLRNVGSGIAVLHSWCFHPERVLSGDRDGPPPLDRFRRLTRDLYIPAGDLGFWQGAFRDPAEPLFTAARDAVNAKGHMTVELLYTDHEGGQRPISRFGMVPREDGNGWLAVVSRHWSLDRPGPR